MNPIWKSLLDTAASDQFPSVASLNKAARWLSLDPRFRVIDLAKTPGGNNIELISFGQGVRTVLVVGGPHAMEPIGSLTIQKLLSLLEADEGRLSSDLTWHIIPCADPDAAQLNEGWTQYPLTLQRFMKNYYQQPYREQVDGCFPISYKNLLFDNISDLASIVKGVIDDIVPDFYFSLHNSSMTGSCFFISRDAGQDCYTIIREMSLDLGIPIEDFDLPYMKEKYFPGVYRLPNIKDYYDFLEQSSGDAQSLLPEAGANSFDYLLEISPSSVSFLSEIGYIGWNASKWEAESDYHYAQLKTKIDERSIRLAKKIIDLLKCYQGVLPIASPFYSSLETSLLRRKEDISAGGMPISRVTSQSIVADPRFDRKATWGEVFQICIFDGGLFFLAQGYQVVRLLQELPENDVLSGLAAEMESAFDDALDEIETIISPSEWHFISPNHLATAQLGSGLAAISATLLQGKCLRQLIPSAGLAD